MTDLIEVKTARLIGVALDWAVTKAAGLEDTAKLVFPAIIDERNQPCMVTHSWSAWSPSTDWSQGGPLIDKHHGSAQHSPGLAEEACYSGGPAGAGVWLYGPTALVAFCRGFVHYKLGDTVQVPKELMPCS
ncbi:phage protein NinX family protein [Pseudomonas sp. NBRC 111130]|uniref:phage protein NinX family protein n=1 Tax=Pseudomonas sp. NBRC 111130 TaxID=1661045 RepID=UPI0006D4126C|nr:phage protein NinX family protein [Pseudomonas sp. NBRC 111130]